MEASYWVLIGVIVLILSGFLVQINITQKCRIICARQNGRTLKKTQGTFSPKCICRQVMKDKEIKYFEYGIDE